MGIKETLAKIGKNIFNKEESEEMQDEETAGKYSYSDRDKTNDRMLMSLRRVRRKQLEEQEKKILKAKIKRYEELRAKSWMKKKALKSKLKKKAKRCMWVNKINK